MVLCLQNGIQNDHCVVEGAYAHTLACGPYITLLYGVQPICSEREIPC